MADARELLKNASGNLRKAQNSFFSGKFDEAYDVLARVDADVAAAAEADPANAKAKTVAGQAAKLRGDLDRRTGRASGGGPVSSQTLPPKPQPKAAAGPRPLPPRPGEPRAGEPAGLPAGVAKRIRDIREAAESGRLDVVRQCLGEIERVYAGQFDESHPEYVEARKVAEEAIARGEAAAAAAAEARVAEEAAREERRRLNDRWRSRFQGLRTFGHATGNASELLSQAERNEAALGVLAEFSAAAPFEMDDDLAAAVSEFRQLTEAFPAFLEETRDSFVRKCLDHVASRSAELDRPIEGKPAIMSDQSLAAVGEFFAQYDKAFGDPQRAVLREALEALRAKNAKNRAERAKLVTMQPDRYAGEDAPQVRAWVEELVRGGRRDAEVLRTVVTKDDWEEISRWEDHAGERRFVTRRDIYAQVAAREHGDVLLHSIAVTKERRSDGTWSGLRGNIMWSEEMLPENVG